MARELATRDHLVLACGRYEGIDQRVVDHAATSYDVEELSLGDFVLNGGEVAALAFIEAVVRLLPGFMGNPESLAEESHEDGLLEYPVYTKPASWRGHDVPQVLLSGDHAAIAAWRHAESVRRTVARRPDLAHPAAQVGLGDLALDISPATRADAGELFTLTRACWLQELWANPGVTIPALEESFDDLLGQPRRLDHVRGARRRAAGRLVARPRRGGRLGRRPGDGRTRPPGPGARSLSPRPSSRKPPRRRSRRTSCSPAPAASTTSGCTRRPATACEVRPRARRVP